jgi:hypothetical protein
MERFQSAFHVNDPCGMLTSSIGIHCQSATPWPRAKYGLRFVGGMAYLAMIHGLYNLASRRLTVRMEASLVAGFVEGAIIALPPRG